MNGYLSVTQNNKKGDSENVTRHREVRPSVGRPGRWRPEGPTTGQTPVPVYSEMLYDTSRKVRGRLTRYYEG